MPSDKKKRSKSNCIQHIIVDVDTDVDDLNVICLLVSLHFKKKIKIDGIICSDGFANPLIGAQMMKYFLEKILHVYDIPVIVGIYRVPYLRARRDFPQNITTDLTTFFYNSFGDFYNYESKLNISLSDFICYVKKQDYQVIYIITGPMTTLSFVLQEYNFAPYIKRSFFSGGNIYVGGDLINPPAAVKTEYNIYIDPDSFRNVLNILTYKLYITPLDASTKIPLTEDTLKKIEKKGSQLIKKSDKKFVNLYETSINLFKFQLTGVNAEIANLYLWDETAVLPAVKLVNAKYTVLYLLVNSDGTLSVYDSKTTLPKKMFAPANVYLDADFDEYINAYATNIL